MVASCLTALLSEVFTGKKAGKAKNVQVGVICVFVPI